MGRKKKVKTEQEILIEEYEKLKDDRSTYSVNYIVKCKRCGYILGLKSIPSGGACKCKNDKKINDYILCHNGEIKTKYFELIWEREK